MSGALMQAARVLGNLARRTRSDDLPTEDSERPGLTAVVDIVGDIGRSVGRHEAHELHRVLPPLAMLREALENGGGVDEEPWLALMRSDKAQPFAAGSLWATSVIVNSVLDQWEHDVHRAEERAHRADVRDAVLRLFEDKDVVSPGDIVEHLQSRGQTASRSTVSKALGDLLRDRVVAPADPPREGDRRRRWFTFVAEG